MVPRKPKVWCNFSPLAGLETRMCQQNKAKWKYGNFKHAGLKKVNAVGYKLEIWKNTLDTSGLHSSGERCYDHQAPTPCWLCNCQDHLQSSFAQVLGEIRSQSSLAHLLCSAPGFLPCERVHNSPLGPAVSRCGLDSHPHKHPRNTGDDAGSLWVESASLFNADRYRKAGCRCKLQIFKSIFHLHVLFETSIYQELVSLYHDLSRWSMVQAWVSCFRGVTLMPFSHCRLWVLPCALGVHLLDLPQEPHVNQANLRHQRLKRQQRWDRRCSICQNPSSTVDGLQDLAPVDIEHQRNFHCLYPLETYKVVCLILSINGVERFASVYLSFFSGDI